MTSMRRILLICVLVFLVRFAHTHPSRRVKSEELEIFADRIVLLLQYEVSEPRFTLDLRERFDADNNRELSVKERSDLEGYVFQRASEDLCLRWDGKSLKATAKSGQTSGLERALPSAYPATFAWKLDFPLPQSLADGPHELELVDSERHWQTSFTCQVRLATAPGRAARRNSGPSGASFDFKDGRGSLKIKVFSKAGRPVEVRAL